MTDKFFIYLEVEKRCSLHTLSSYKSDLKQCIAFLEAFYPGSTLENAQAFMFRAWVVSMMENKISPATIHRKMSSVKSFYKYACAKSLLRDNPVKTCLLPKKNKRLPNFVEESAMENILDNFHIDGFNDYRDFIILLLFYAGGLRLSELIALKKKDVRLDQSQIKVLGKRNKERIIPLPGKVCEELKNYLDICSVQFPEYESLFFRENGKPLYPVLVQRMVKKYLSLFSSSAKKSPHVLRHTYATHLLNGGADLNAVKELLGHAGLAATQVYTHNSIKELIKIYNQAHPRAD